ncbi:MAG TPA: hypothetical protein PLK34_02375 [Candidatus Pacearchaeota archaeon]|nr:hypothetical protein [Candidatus Pacearchaeota archaeon]
MTQEINKYQRESPFGNNQKMAYEELVRTLDEYLGSGAGKLVLQSVANQITQEPMLYNEDISQKLRSSSTRKRLRRDLDEILGLEGIGESILKAVTTSPEQKMQGKLWALIDESCSLESSNNISNFLKILKIASKEGYEFDYKRLFSNGVYSQIEITSKR